MKTPASFQHLKTMIDMYPISFPRDTIMFKMNSRTAESIFSQCDFISDELKIKGDFDGEKVFGVEISIDEALDDEYILLQQKPIKKSKHLYTAPGCIGHIV